MTATDTPATASSAPPPGCRRPARSLAQLHGQREAHAGGGRPNRPPLDALVLCRPRERQREDLADNWFGRAPIVGDLADRTVPAPWRCGSLQAAGVDEERVSAVLTWVS